MLELILKETLAKKKKEQEEEEKKKAQTVQEKKSSSDDTITEGGATPDTTDGNNHTVSGAEKGVSEQMQLPQAISTNSLFKKLILLKAQSGESELFVLIPPTVPG